MDPEKTDKTPPLLMLWRRSTQPRRMPAPGQQQPASGVAQRRAAYEQILRRYQVDLLRIARRYCRGNEDQAQDLVQEALVRGYRAYIDGRFTDGTNARAWLVRILTNVFLTSLRRTTNRDVCVDEDALAALGEAGHGSPHARDGYRPDTALMDATLDEPLERALGTLSDDLRAAVVLVDVEALEYAEAAEAMGVPIGTVRSRLYRARAQLHALLYSYARERRRA
jgi:RNA polymerase sigma-70 factor (ECF subfamily)